MDVQTKHADRNNNVIIEFNLPTNTRTYYVNSSEPRMHN